MHLYIICSTRTCVSFCTCMGKDSWEWCHKTETPGSIPAILVICTSQWKSRSDSCPTFRQASWIEVTVSIALHESRIWHACPAGVSRDQITWGWTGLQRPVAQGDSAKELPWQVTRSKQIRIAQWTFMDIMISIYTLHKCHILPTCTWKCPLVTQHERLTLSGKAGHFFWHDAETGVPLSSITKTLTQRVPSNKTVAKQMI